AAPVLGRGLPPAAATRLLVLVSAMVAASGLVVAGMLAFTWLARLPEVVELGPWSATTLRVRTPVPIAVAVVATVLVATSIVRAGMVSIRRASAMWTMRRELSGLAHADGLIVVNDERPDAYSTPPPGGRIVVTAGLLR